MGLLPFKKFLCCIPLETGGLIVGWVSAISSFILMSFYSTILIFATLGYSRYFGRPEELGFLSYVVLVLIISIYLIYLLIVLIASIMLIGAVKRRDYAGMLPFLVLMVIGVFLAFLQLLSTEWAGLGIAIWMVTVDVYFFLCIYSLYAVFRDESLGNIQQPIPLEPMPTPAQSYGFGQQGVVYQQPTPYFSGIVPYTQEPYTDSPVAYSQLHDHDDQLPPKSPMK